ncbi:hypothetical protein HW537_13945 [Asaia siamensis]
MELSKLVDNVTAAVRDMHNKTVEKFLDKTFEIKLCWVNEERFAASASKSKNGEVYTINISLFIIERLANYAADFNTIRLSKDFKEKLSNINDIDKDLFSVEMAPSFFNERMIKTLVMWVYYHELAHIVQSHIMFSDYIGMSIVNDELFLLEEYQEKNLDPAVSHLLEYSADSEAIFNITRLLISSNKVFVLYKHEFWAFCVGLYYVLSGFYDESQGAGHREVRGSHPDPAMRMRMMMYSFDRTANVLFHYPLNSDWLGRTGAGRNVMLDAVRVANLCVEYPGVGIKKEFYDNIARDDIVCDEYSSLLFKKWQDIGQKIIKKYFGNTIDGILFLSKEDNIS